MSNDNKAPQADDLEGAEDVSGVKAIVPEADADIWLANAGEAVLALAASGATFTADDVRRVGHIPEPARAQQWGVLFRTLRAAGYITPVGAGYSTRRQRHHGLLHVWVGTEFAGGAL